MNFLAFPSLRFAQSVVAGGYAIVLTWLGMTTVGRCAAAGTVADDDAYSTRVWQAEDGLPENRVVGVAQAPDGFLWVATLAGTVRFDGVRFQTFDSRNYRPLSSGLMQGILCDHAGRIWLAKELGTLICVSGQEVITYGPSDGLPQSQAALALAEDGSGDLWISYSKGSVLRVKDGKIEDYTTHHGLSGGGICWLATGQDGQLWFVKNGKVGVFRNDQFQVLSDSGSAATLIAAARSGGVWICTPHSVSHFSESDGLTKLTDFVPYVPGNEPTAVLEDDSGSVWVGTESAGLFRWDTNGVQRVKTSHLAILCLLQDREGNLWVGTRGGGLDRVHRRVVSMATTATGLPFSGVQSVCLDTGGTIWAVGNNGELACQTNNTWQVIFPEAGDSKYHCTSVAADLQGSIWLGTRGGHLFHRVNGRFEDPGWRRKLNGRSIRGLLMATNGDLWIATDAPQTIYRLRGDVLKTFQLRPGFRYIRALTMDAAGDFWAGGSDGLLVRITGDELTDLTPQTNTASIRCLYGAANGDLWIGYAGAGAGRWRNGRFTEFTRDQGLPNNYVSQILEDGRGGLWFAGNQGIFKVRARDFDDVAAGRSTMVQPFIYGRSEGLQGLQATFDFCPLTVRSPDHRLFFSMLSGLAEVRLDYMRYNRLPPPVYIERVIADGRVYAAYRDGEPASDNATNGILELAGLENHAVLRLPPGLQNVRFEFTALSFTAPENDQFRYRMEGLDDHWVNADNRRVAEYTHPPPGTYRFQVIACNNDGVWNETGDSLPVKFDAFIWEKAWFKVSVTLLAFSAGCGLVIYFLRRRHLHQIEQLEHQRALEIERTRIARDLHDDLGVGLTEIGLLGDLAGNEGNLPETSRNRVQEITGRARSLVSALDEIVWAINPANDSSESLVEYLFPYAQRLLDRAGIRSRLQVHEPLPAGKINAEKRHGLFYAFKEALNNVIRHSDATEVQVTLAARDGNLLVRVADNGRGVEAAAGRGAHHGLAGMRERLQRLGGRCEFTDTPGGGATVTFVLPVQPES